MGIQQEGMAVMRTRILKFARGGASVALLATGLGAVGALGIGLATGGVAGASVATGVTAVYNCTAPVAGHFTTTIATVDLNTTPASLFTNTTYSVHLHVRFHASATLIHLATTFGQTKIGITYVKSELKLHGFTATTTLTKQSNSAPVTIPVNTTTLTNGANATFTFAPFTVTMKAVTGTATINSPKVTAKVLTAVTVPCTAVAGTAVGSFVKIASLGVTPLTLSPTSGALPAATATLLYTHGSSYWTAAGGAGGNVFSETGTLDGLTFSSSGNHASLTGTPSAAGTFPFSVTVTTGTGTSVTNTYTIDVATAPATPKVVQPFKLTVTPGSLTLTCTSTSTGPVATPAAPKATKAVETQATAKNCTLITLGHVTLNETNQLVQTRGHGLIISTARGEPTDSWALYAVMVPTSTTLTANPACGTVQGFCNVTTTGATTLAHHFANTSILPNYLSVSGYSCTPNQTATTPYYNTNPTPTVTAGQTPGTPAGLSVQYELCTAAAGSSGGEFFVRTLGYSLIVPPNVYAGTYYGTVQYTLSASATVVPPNPVTPPQ